MWSVVCRCRSGVVCENDVDNAAREIVDADTVGLRQSDFSVALWREF